MARWRSSTSPRAHKAALPAADHSQLSLPGSGKPPASPRPAATAPVAAYVAPDPASAEVKAAARALRRPADAQRHAVGTLCFGALLWIAGVAPWSLPLVFIAFACTCLPYRAWCYATKEKRVNITFLLDFCYFVNAATGMFLLWFPEDKRLETLVYALADGPLAAALLAWQCPWVFGSIEHTISVLLHLLPGLAMFAHHYHADAGLRGWRQMAAPWSSIRASVAQPMQYVTEIRGAEPSPLVFWLVVAPLMFFLAWVAMYYLVVQVLMRSAIKTRGWDTSYNCLARRAAKTNNIWNRLVRRGSVQRRCLMYGALQLAFTVAALVAFLPTYFWYPAAVLMQVLKFAFPVWYGSSYQCDKLQRDAFLRGVKLLHAHSTATAAVAAKESRMELGWGAAVALIKQQAAAVTSRRRQSHVQTGS